MPPPPNDAPDDARPAARPARRLQSLDGLRGVASLAVLFHHALLTVPALARVHYVNAEVDHDDRLAWALTHTPLHVLWAGTEAVYLFFVLSGLVLALPAFQWPWRSWLEYYPRRLVRLYLPLFAAVAWGVLLVTVVHRSNSDAYGEWLVRRPNGASWSGLVEDLTLLRGVSSLISPLWSLQWEVWFSLLLPLYVVAAVAVRRLPLWLPFLGGLVLVGAGVFLRSGALTHLPMFWLGVLIATRLPTLTARATVVRPRGWAVATLVMVVLVTAHWWLLPLTTSPLALHLATPASVLGAAGLVLVAALSPQARRLLELRPVQWLGTISFSLYLVHEPIVIALGFLVGPGSGLLVLCLAVPVSLLAGWLFYRGVELPAHRASRRVGRWTGRLLSPQTAPRAVREGDTTG